jgi:hypothetical protein
MIAGGDNITKPTSFADIVSVGVVAHSAARFKNCASATLSLGVAINGSNAICTPSEGPAHEYQRGRSRLRGRGISRLPG